MAKILCVLYDDPVDGYPKSYPRDGLPVLESYPGGQTLPSPQAIDFIPGQLLGSVSGELGLRKFLEGLGHTLVVTSDKDGPDSVFERELPDCGRRHLAAVLARVPDRGDASRRRRGSSSPSPPGSDPTTSTCRRRSSTASPSPR